jgi:cytochrome b561
VAFWGVVKLISTQDGISQLPPEDDEKVADLANVMFYFFIICIILLGIYLICSVLVIIGAAKVSTLDI